MKERQQKIKEIVAKNKELRRETAMKVYHSPLTHWKM